MTVVSVGHCSHGEGRGARARAIPIPNHSSSLCVCHIVNIPLSKTSHDYHQSVRAPQSYIAKAVDEGKGNNMDFACLQNNYL